MFHAPRLRDSRAALLAPTPSIYRFRLTLPPRPLLRLAAGYVLTPDAPSRHLTYKVKLSRLSGETETVLEQLVETRAEGTWQDLEVDLSPWAGEEVVLVLETTAASSGTAWAAWGVPEIATTRRQAPGPDVILISLDTLRADHLSSHGYHRPTSPNLDALASTGVRFATAVAQSPWTRPSHRSMFSGLYPASRGGSRPQPLALELWRAGYRTAAITGGGQVDARFGFQTGFETYRVDYWLHSIDQAVDWLEAGRDRNDFLFLHTFEIHDPYSDARFTDGLPPGRVGDQFSVRDREGWARNKLTREERAYVEALYDGGIAYTDERLGSILDRLASRGLLENTIVIVTSDHGEAFWEHGAWRHGTTMYDHQLLVPLILHLPEELRRQLGVSPGMVIDQQVELIDLYPTLLDLLGIELGHEVQGATLRPLLEGTPMPPRRAFAENTNHKTYERKAIRTARFKFVYSFLREAEADNNHPYFELYDLVEDPDEQTNLAEESPDFVQAQLAQIRALLTGDAGDLDEELPAGIDPDLEAQLKALGYAGD